MKIKRQFFRRLLLLTFQHQRGLVEVVNTANLLSLLILDRESLYHLNLNAFVLKTDTGGFIFISWFSIVLW